MSLSENQNKLVTLIAELKEEAALDLVQQFMAEGLNPINIIDLCHKGMIEVGKLYEQGTYFISGLIMAGEIMRQVSQMVFPLIESESIENNAGSIVLGTVEGDIHFIGKDIFKTLVRVNGFTVHDLGVDVPPAKFLAAVQEYRPTILGLSCLITASFRPMQETITLLRNEIAESLSPRAYIIGGQVNEQICSQVGADYWADNAMDGVRICQKIIDKSPED
jgi:methanogenic corrinoid protein MtbC1